MKYIIPLLKAWGCIIAGCFILAGAIKFIFWTTNIAINVFGVPEPMAIFPGIFIVAVTGPIIIGTWQAR